MLELIVILVSLLAVTALVGVFYLAYLRVVEETPIGEVELRVCAAPAA
jgi:hypothetical protein